MKTVSHQWYCYYDVTVSLYVNIWHNDVCMNTSLGLVLKFFWSSESLLEDFLTQKTISKSLYQTCWIKGNCCKPNSRRCKSALTHSLLSDLKCLIIVFSIVEIFSPHCQLVIIGNWKTKLQGSLPRAVSLMPDRKLKADFPRPPDQTLFGENTHMHEMLFN